MFVGNMSPTMFLERLQMSASHREVHTKEKRSFHNVESVVDECNRSRAVLKRKQYIKTCCCLYRRKPVVLLLCGRDVAAEAAGKSSRFKDLQHTNTCACCARA